MPFFKYPGRRFRRRREFYSLKTTTSGPLSTTTLEVEKLIRTQRDSCNRKGFELEMKSFLKLLSRYLDQKSRPPTLDWNNVQRLKDEQLAFYDTLPTPANTEPLTKLAVLKLNGGLGATMGMYGAKSALEVKDGLTLLDMTIQQILHTNSTHNIDVPLVIMTSFKTYDDTLHITKKYANQPIGITLFNQSRYPQVTENTYLPCPKSIFDDAWYPPGNGDLFTALDRSGVLDSLLSDGKEYIFISNSDNLGATIDQQILHHMIDSNSEFLIEVTNKTTKDDNGGATVNYEGAVRLIELDQVPPEHAEDFKSAKNFKSFNTNNMWINLKAIKRVINGGEMELDIIEKMVFAENGKRIQLETAAASAIKYFENPQVVNVPRKRFLPVKTCSDLLLIKSDVFEVDKGCLILNNSRTFQTIPTIKLSDHFRNIDHFRKRFKTVPSIIDLDLLTVTGDVYFGRSVTLRGTIIITASEGKRIDIPDGCILENTLLAGNLGMIEL